MTICYHECCKQPGAFHLMVRLWPKASQIAAEGYRMDQVLPLNVKLLAPVCLKHSLEIIADPHAVMLPSLWSEIEGYAAVAARWVIDRSSLKMVILADVTPNWGSAPEPNALNKPAVKSKRSKK